MSHVRIALQPSGEATFARSTATREPDGTLVVTAIDDAFELRRYPDGAWIAVVESDDRGVPISSIEAGVGVAHVYDEEAGDGRHVDWCPACGAKE